MNLSDHRHQMTNTRRRIFAMTLKASTLLRLAAVAAGVVLGLTVTVVVHAARNSSGSYALPSGNPVVSGTSITTTWANTTLGDIGTELTNSLDRTGKGTMLAPLKVVDGTVSAPAFTFTNEPGSGLYRVGSSNPAIAVSGAKRQEWTSTGTTVQGTLACTGAATLDSLGVTNNATVGGTLGVTGNTTIGGTLGITGTVTLPATGSGSTEAARKDYVDTADALKAPLASPTFTGTVTAATLSATTLSVSSTAAFTGKPTAAATVTGDGATTLTTKGYVDGLSDGLASIVAGTNWTVDASSRLLKQPNGLVALYLRASVSSGTATTIATLPAGYRPATVLSLVVLDASGGPSFTACTISTGGAITLVAAPTVAHQYYVQAVFSTT